MCRGEAERAGLDAELVEVLLDPRNCLEVDQRDTEAVVLPPTTVRRVVAVTSRGAHHPGSHR